MKEDLTTVKFRYIYKNLLKNRPPGGLDSQTFRLTAERASQLRHGGLIMQWYREKKII